MKREYYLIGINIALVLGMVTYGLKSHNAEKEKKTKFETPETRIDNRPLSEAEVSNPAPLPDINSPQGKAHVKISPDNKLAIVPARLDQCETECRARIIDSLRRDGTVSSDEAAYISENAAFFAQLLSNNPLALAGLLTNLDSDEEEHADIQKAARLVLAELSHEARLSAAANLLRANDEAHRIVGLNLIGKDFTQSTQLSRQFYNVALEETNSLVLTVALNNITSLDPESPQAIDIVGGLDNLIQNGRSDYISGSALVAKAKLTASSEAIKDDISATITSSSAELKRYGLNALAVIIDKEIQAAEATNSPTTARPWIDRPELLTALNGIANDPNMRERDRENAAKLIAGENIRR